LVGIALDVQRALHGGAGARHDDGFDSLLGAGRAAGQSQDDRRHGTEQKRLKALRRAAVEFGYCHYIHSPVIFADLKIKKTNSAPAGPLRHNLTRNKGRYLTATIGYRD